MSRWRLSRRVRPPPPPIPAWSPSSGRAPGEFESAFAVGVAGTGDVYVSDGVAGPLLTPSRIQRFSSTGQFFTQWEVGLPPVSDLAIDDSGTVYAANSVAGVRKYDAAGN